MATKVIILGEPQQEQKKKPIEFVKFLSFDGTIKNASRISMKPSNYANVELISRKYTEEGFDLMFAYDNDRNDEDTTALFLGFFNDGFVE